MTVFERSPFVAWFAAVLCLAISPEVLHAKDGVEIKQAWARETVPGQKVGAVYMEIISARDARLTGVRSAAARMAEIHSMAMEDGMMKMRQVPFVELPAGTAIHLAPGGLHVMLFDLKKPLSAGGKVSLTLNVETGGKPRKIRVQASVRGREESLEGPEHK